MSRNCINCAIITIMREFSLKSTITFKVYRYIISTIEEFVSTVGYLVIYGRELFSLFFKLEFDKKAIIEQCARFGVSSLPITLSIVGMTSIIVSMQVAGEMVKQGAGNYVGMLVTMLLVREAGVIMSGFAIIFMIGSSMASEIATMRVTEQIDAIQVAKVNPIRYLFVPRVVSGVLMMPPVLVVATLVGVIGGGVAAHLASGLSYRAYFESVWSGLYMKDMNVALLKAIAFGFTIALISFVCGYTAKGGARGVGLATTKSVVWSFVAIVLWDLLFSIVFFF